MKRLILLVLLVTLTQSFIVPRLGNPQPLTPKIYKLQLNDLPENRWTHIVQDFKPRLQKFFYFLSEWLPIPEIAYQVVAFWGNNFFPYTDILQELRGIARDVEIPFSRVFFFQFFYEWSRLVQCSAIVLRNNENQILHGRNWDFEFFVFFSRLSATVEFYRGSQYVATAEMIVGSSLIITGIKNGEYAITVNARKNTVATFKDILVNLLVKNYIPPDFFLRIVFEQANNFNEAVKMLNETNLATAIYYAISGKNGNEGIVIERDPDSIHGFYQINETNWFLVQTNYDRNVPDPIHDPRRIPAEKRLEKIGQTITINQLQENIMRKWPTFNLATIMTFMAIPSTSYRNTMVWYGLNGGPYKKIDNMLFWEKETLSE